MSGSRDIRLTPLKRALNQKGDVSIGAYARRMRVQRWLLGGLGVVLVLGAGVTYALLRPNTPHASGAVEYAQCGACERLIELPVDSKRTYPAMCPHCNKKTARPAWSCRACDARFTPASDERMPYRCPECRSSDVGALLKADVDD